MSFGIVIACCPRDIRYLKGCLASIRHYMPLIPVHLIIDGDSTDSLRQIAAATKCTLACRSETRDPNLKALSFGWGLTKMVALWESPFERFLCLDPDAVCYGDIAAHDRADYDFIPAVDGIKRTDAWVNDFFYDLAFMQRFCPQYDWRSVKDLHFASGCFFARRNVLELARYLNVLETTRNHPDQFKCGDQGILNFMVLHAFQRKQIKLVRAGCDQILVNEFDRSFLARQYRFKAIVRPEDATVLHYAGVKPDLFRRESFRLMTTWRIEYRRSFSVGQAPALLSLALEDLPVLSAGVKSAIRRTASRFSGHPG